MYEKEHDNIKIEGTYDSSGNLQTQIEQGMDTDIFFSAATQQMDELIAEELIDKDSEIGLLENKLVLITPENNPKEVEDFADLKKMQIQSQLGTQKVSRQDNTLKNH